MKNEDYDVTTTLDGTTFDLTLNDGVFRDIVVNIRDSRIEEKEECFLVFNYDIKENKEKITAENKEEFETYLGEVLLHLIDRAIQ